MHSTILASEFEPTKSSRCSCRSGYDEIVQRDKASLDLFWLRDESLEDSDHLPAPEIIAAEIVEDLEAALAQFAEISASLGGSAPD